MTLTKFWEKGGRIDRNCLHRSAVELDNADRVNLLAQLAEFWLANQLLREAIAQPSDEKFARACALLGDAGFEKGEQVTPLRIDQTTPELRRLVKHETILAAALQAACRAGTTDRATIAIATLTSQEKIEKWGKALVDDGQLKNVHLALASHNLRYKHYRHEYEAFQLITSLHDRGCLIQRDGEVFWFFGDDFRGVVFFNDWRPGYKHRNCLFLTTLDDRRPYFEWPGYFKSIPRIDEVWSMLTDLSTDSEFSPTNPLYLTCPFCQHNNVNLGRYFETEYSLEACPHVAYLELNSSGELVESVGLLSDNSGLASVKGKGIDYLARSKDDWTAIGLFVKSEADLPGELEPYAELNDPSELPEFRTACARYIDRIKKPK
ncbi:hypothetical protein SH467x_000413 [Pirellulaceae bacterium SH467]